MIMIVKYLATDGGVPVNVEARATDRHLVIEWADTEICLPIEEVKNILAEDDLK